MARAKTVSTASTATVNATTSAVLANNPIVNALGTQVVEAKLSKSELMDLIVEGLVDDLTVELEAAQKEYNALKSPNVDSEFVKLAPLDAEVRVNNWSGDKYHVTVSFDLAGAELPAAYSKYQQDVKDAQLRTSALKVKVDKLTRNKVRAKNEIIRKSLETTTDGQKILASVNQLKMSLKAKFLPE